MQPSSRLAEFVRSYETLVLKAMLPTKNDVWTIGYGHTAGVRPGMVWTKEQADNVFDRELNSEFGAFVARCVEGKPTSQQEYDAMVSLCFNIGQENFKRSSVLANHLAGRRSTAALAFGLWNKQRDRVTGELRVLKGLTKRRAAEAAIYKDGVYVNHR